MELHAGKLRSIINQKQRNDPGAQEMAWEICWNTKKGIFHACLEKLNLFLDSVHIWLLDLSD